MQLLFGDGAAKGGGAAEVSERFQPEDAQGEAAASGEAARELGEQEPRAPEGYPQEGLAEGAEVAVAAEDEGEEGGFAAAIGAELADEVVHVLAVGVVNDGVRLILDLIVGL